MRIGINALCLQPKHKGGAESVFFNLVKGFSNKGVGSNIIYFCYPEMAEMVGSLSPESKVVIVDANVWDRHTRISLNIVQTRYFYKMYKKYDLDVILFASADMGIFKYKVPTIVLPHDIQNVSRPEMNSNKLEYQINYWYYRICFKNADRIIAISNVDKEEISKYYPFAASKIAQIYDPIDVEEEDIQIIEKKENYILAVNIQYVHKNIDTLIKAFSLIYKKYPGIKLKLVGAKTEYTARLESYVEKKGLKGEVEFLGFVSKEELVDLWRKARLYVNPSIYEGFGMTSVESILYGAPTLLGDIQVNREVTDNLCNYYSDLKNKNELAKRMQELLNKTYDLEESTNKARKLVDRYKLGTICDRYWCLMETLYGKNRGDK